MQVKTFEAISYKDAIKSIKRELGNDAVILSTREKTMEGSPGTRIVEVTAATPDAPRHTRGGATAHSSDTHELEGRLQSLDLRLTALSDNAATKRELQNVDSSLNEIKALLLEAIRSKDGSISKDLPAHIGRVERQLRLMGVDASFIASLIEHLTAIPADGGNDQDLIASTQAHAIRWMMKRLKIAPKWNAAHGGVAIHTLVGPPGTGKTTAAAKLAAHFQLREKKKVLLLSYDNTRLAAAEQLRVYAKILGSPFTVIENAEDLPAKLAQHRDVEVVIIDTAGVSTKNPRHIRDIERLKAQQLPVDFHLVLSTIEKEEQLNRSVQYFAPVGIQSLVFTKLDETWSFGDIFNISAKWSTPLSWFSTGQEIPENLERASRERVVERIFGV